MTAEKKPRIIVQKYKDGKPVDKPEVKYLSEADVKKFGKSLEKQPDEDGLVTSKS